MAMTELRSHPAKFTDLILEAMRVRINDEAKRVNGVSRLADCTEPIHVFDPFAGVGRIWRLHRDGLICVSAMEIEREWAGHDSRTIVGDSLAWMRESRATGFHVIATSPCLAQSHRILTDDLRWVPAGDVREGDPILAFDETGRPGSRGTASRRRWRRAEVVRSVPRTLDCVRVILGNGDEIITTPEHPWLAYRYAYGDRAATWVASQDLMGLHAPHVFLQVQPWTERRSYDAGWLAGMYDGEGSLSLGAHGSPKLTLYQVDGPVMDRAERLLHQFGYDPNVIPRKNMPPGRRPVHNLYVGGGFPGILRALGELRPGRLLEKWAGLDISTRTVQAERVPVLAVEPAGRHDIQEIETTAGTYLGEGYLMHNCYANRLADCHDARDDSERHSYRHDLGRMPSAGSNATYPWGPKYWRFMGEFYRLCVQALVPGGLLLLNVSNFQRAKVMVNAVRWHEGACWGAGLVQNPSREPTITIPTPRLRYGENHDARAESEVILRFRRPAA